MIDMILGILSGLGIFLFGMSFLEDALKDASGRSFKRILKRSTDTVPKAIFTGAISTAALQSSSVVSLMALSFVGAGLMQLSSGIGVIFGANIGTTFTAWIVAMVGFKIKVDIIALPLIGIAGIILVFFKKHIKINAISRIAIGFGLLFLGLEFMKNSTEIIAKDFDLSDYMAYGAYVYVIIGFFLTATLQSSSASTAIILSSLNSGIVTFDIAAAMVIGSNVGTTVTAILGSIGGKADKKRAAIAHVAFNVGTGVIAYIFIGVLSIFILDTMGFRDDTITALAIFHTLFNVLGVLIFAPFVPLLTRGLNKIYQKKPEILTQYIDSVQTDVFEAAIEALRKEVIRLHDASMRFGLMLFNIDAKDLFDKNIKMWKILANENQIASEEIVSAYRKIKKLEIQILEYASDIGSKELSIDESKGLSKLIEATREITYASKMLKDIKLNIQTFYEEDNIFLQESYETYRERISKLFKNIHQLISGDVEAETKMRKILQTITDENNASTSEITKAIKGNNVSDELTSSILNANRSIYLASQSLVESAFYLTQANNLFKDEAKREA